MSRVTDVQISQLRDWAIDRIMSPKMNEVLDLLESERSRADEAERAVLVERERGERAEEMETACVHEGLETEVAYIKELAEARAWAEWAFAEAQHHQTISDHRSHVIATYQVELAAARSEVKK